MGTGTPITDLVKSSKARNFFMMSHHRPTVHEAFAKRFCQPAKRNGEAAKKQLDIFLARNPGFDPKSKTVVDVELLLEYWMHPGFDKE